MAVVTTLSDSARRDQPAVYPAGLRVAVVDDDQDVRNALRRLLRSMHIWVETFASAEEFLEAEGASRPDCLVLDINLGGMSGIELRERLQQGGRRVPVVFITAQEQEQAARALAGVEGVPCLRKPFSNAALLGAIRSAVWGA